jgi:cytochrome P450
MDISKFDPTAPAFNADPYAAYAAFRAQAPVALIGAPYGAHWVFSRDLVADVLDPKNKNVFLKPGMDRAGDSKRPFSLTTQFGDGMFFMDPPRHTEVRATMNAAFDAAIANVRDVAQKIADTLLDKAMGDGRLEVITGYAGPLAMQVFFQVMGVPVGDDQDTEWFVVDSWIRQALSSHDKGLQPMQRLPGGSAAMAMRTYFAALGREAAAANTSTQATSIMAGMQRNVASKSPMRMSEDEATNTALQMALGGYLSTEFLIGSGLYNLLRDPSQWAALRYGDASLAQAVNEMLRFDAPFQMADRWVAEDTPLGKVTLPGGKMFTLVYGSANRDPECCQNPDRFDITRDENLPHFGFGDHIHRCIGEPMARTVAAVAVETLMQRCAGVRIGEVGPWGADPYFRTLSKLVLLLR